jgi:hypothetical protein
MPCSIRRASSGQNTYKRQEQPHFTVDQLNKILAIAEDPWRTLFCISTLDGLRAGELLGLQ